MEQRSMTDLVSHAFEPKRILADQVLCNDIAEVNALRLKDKPTTGLNIPTASGIEQIAQWMIDCKRNNPTFSKRQVRKAAQQRFNVKIFRPSYKKENAIRP